MENKTFYEDDLSSFYHSGADIIGVNCSFDPEKSLETIGLMKEALDKAGLKPHLMVQPVGYHGPDTGLIGFPCIPENPFGEFPRLNRAVPQLYIPLHSPVAINSHLFRQTYKNIFYIFSYICL